MMHLLPRRPALFELLGSRAGNLARMTGELRELLQQFERLDEGAARIEALRQAGEETALRLASEVHASFETPLDREDLLSLGRAVEEAERAIEEGAVLLALYQLPAASPDSQQLAELLSQAAHRLREAVEGLGSLSGLGALEGPCVEIRRLAGQGRRLFRQARGVLYTTPGVDPIMALRWKDVYESLDRALGEVEEAARVLETMRLKDG